MSDSLDMLLMERITDTKKRHMTRNDDKIEIMGYKMTELEEYLYSVKRLVKQLENKISHLEEMTTCEFCGDITHLQSCYECEKRGCEDCTKKHYTKNYALDSVCMFFCKQCR